MKDFSKQLSVEEATEDLLKYTVGGTAKAVYDGWVVYNDTLKLRKSFAKLKVALTARLPGPTLLWTGSRRHVPI
jgi:hypothetical protein